MAIRTDWVLILVQAFVTVIVGVVVYVLGELAISFYIKPVNKLADAIGEVLDSLVFYANIYTNPARGLITEEERRQRNQASDVLRQKATLLLSRKTRIRLYSVATFFGAIPTENDIDEAHGDLIFLSNSCFMCNPKGTFLLAERIKKLLTSNETPPKVSSQDLAVP